jgi:glycosyltransferase involved in cell wall biosynthesis
MDNFSAKTNQIVYLITNSAKLNQRLQGVLSLKESFAKMVLVAKAGVPADNGRIMVRPYHNPLGILRLVGLEKLKKVFEKYLFFPSTNVLYMRPVIKYLKKRVAQDLSGKKRVCLLTSLPPHDLSMIGLALKSNFPEIRWVADWQDLWSWDEYYFERTLALYRNRLLRLEKEALSMADINVTTNLKAKAVLEKHYKIPSDRVVSINHHYQQLDFPERVSTIARNGPKSEKTIKIGFLGNLFKPPKVPGSKIVEAVENLYRSNIDVALHIYGDTSVQAKEAALNARNGSVVLHPRTTHEQSLKNLSKCHFFLLALSDSPNCRVIMHSKLPHYLMLNRPILAIVPPNSFAAELIRETRSGYIIPTDSNWEHELKEILTTYLNEQLHLPRNDDEIYKYSWENISRQWIQVLKG